MLAGSDLWRSLAQTPPRSGAHGQQVTSALALSGGDLKTSRDAGSPTSLGDLQQCCPTAQWRRFPWVQSDPPTDPDCFFGHHPLLCCLPLPRRVWLCHLNNCS